MFIDARTLDTAAPLGADVCIVGGGVAGITLALEFERHKLDVIVLESGGFRVDEATRDLYRGENVGLPYVFADGCRSRFLGGSSNCWGGWCGPLREHDMESRHWVPDSGWPISRADLQPYYERAHPVLSLGPFDYDIASWVKAIDRPDVRRIPLPSGRIEDIVSQFSSPSRMGKVHRDALAKSQHIRVMLYANVTDIQTDSTAQHVRGVQVKTFTGREFNIAARAFVVACGGIENARLLLASNKVQAEGLGNSNDLVGRYFADHPRLSLGQVRFKPKWRRNKLYDIKFHYLNRAVSANGTYVSSQFSLDRRTQEREGLLNAQLWFASEFPGEGSSAAEALIRTKHRLHGKGDPTYTLGGDLLRMAVSPLNVLSFAAARVLQPESLIKGVKIEIACEPTPNRNSRITLSGDRDRLGMPRVRVDWQLDELVKRTYDRTLAIFADELRDADVAEVDLPPALSGRDWPVVPPTPWHHLGTWHHMGTTRMHDSPRHGVVDRHCRVHGMSNLFVAGSSVFPSYGANYPTITIAALSLRLADHLAAVLRGGVAAPGLAAPEPTQPAHAA